VGSIFEAASPTAEVPQPLFTPRGTEERVKSEVRGGEAGEEERGFIFGRSWMGAESIRNLWGPIGADAVVLRIVLQRVTQSERFHERAGLTPKRPRSPS